MSKSLICLKNIKRVAAPSNSQLPKHRSISLKQKSTQNDRRTITGEDHWTRGLIERRPQALRRVLFTNDVRFMDHAAWPTAR